MNRSDVVAHIAKEESLAKKRAEELVTLILDTMKTALTEGEKVQISGFGTFEVMNRAPRVGRNPKTNEEISIPATRRPVFRPSRLMRDYIDG